MKTVFMFLRKVFNLNGGVNPTLLYIAEVGNIQMITCPPTINLAIYICLELWVDIFFQVEQYDLTASDMLIWVKRVQVVEE